MSRRDRRQKFGRTRQRITNAQVSANQRCDDLEEILQWWITFRDTHAALARPCTEPICPAVIHPRLHQTRHVTNNIRRAAKALRRYIEHHAKQFGGPTPRTKTHISNLRAIETDPEITSLDPQPRINGKGRR